MKPSVFLLAAAALLSSCQFDFYTDLSNPNDPKASSYLREVVEASGTPEDEGVLLNWAHPAQSKAAGTEITWTPADGPAQPVQVPSGEKSFRVSGLKNGTTYTFTLRAYNLRGDKKEGVPLTAVPAGLRFTVTYDANQGTGTAPQDSLLYKSGSLHTLPGPGELVRNGYTFAGWNTKPDGTGEAKAEGSTHTVSGSDLVWYAQWEGLPRQVSFHANGGTGSMDPQAGKTGQTLTLAAPGFSRPGWSFAGWNTQADGKGTGFADRGNLTLEAAEVTLYAQWMATTNTLSFNGNGGTGTMDSIFVATGSTITLPASLFTRTGYTFSGWNTRASGEGVSTVDKGSYTMGPSSQVFYAQWTPVTYHLTYQLEGGTQGVGQPTSYTVESPALVLLEPTKPGYTFQGWYADQALSQKITQIPQGSTGDKTLWALWASSNADLSALYLSTGTLNPTFSAGTTAYTVSVANATTSITVTGTKADSTATLSANSGVAQNLNVGSNTITLRVTAQDGTTKDYGVTVTRLSNNANLSALSLSTGTLSPVFSAGTTAYTVSVANATTSITVTGTKADSTATLSANSGMAQNLNVGSNVITLRVTAQDGTTKDYGVTVTRAAQTIDIASIPGITAPVTGATPVTTITATAQYTGTVSWSPAVSNMFVSNTAYTATITLTPKAGFTFTGVTTDFFTVAGTTSAANPANSGVITAVFPGTTANLAAVTDYTGTGVGTLKAVQGGTFNNGTANMTVSSFRMSQHEITMEQFVAVTGLANPSSSFTGVVNGPVQTVNWYHALVFCNKLSTAEGLTPVYSISGTTNTTSWGAIPTIINATWDAVVADWSANGYRLPTEAEWQFAARGGNSTNNYTYAGSNTIGEVAWYLVNSGSTTRTVGTKAANELGLYDMSGNVWEWCWDWYGSYPGTAQTDYRGAASGSSRVLRGGSWNSDASWCPVAYRSYDGPYDQYYGIGFRVVRP